MQDIIITVAIIEMIMDRIVNAFRMARSVEYNVGLSGCRQTIPECYCDKRDKEEGRKIRDIAKH